jgi:hypothetical protein
MRAVYIIAGILLTACTVLAANDKAGVTRGDAQPDAAQKSADELMPVIPDVEPLGKTVRLLFRLDPEDKGEPRRLLYVLSAGTRYRVSSDYVNANNVYGIEITGTLKIMDDGGVLTGFHAFLRQTGRDGDSQFAASGSIILKPGKPAVVASLGDKALVLTFEEAAEAPR